ncbi:SET domain-containing protein [Mollisia scopiformis]|uniref:SET domain-containing protein n=1 Tax=Mollisia scopiformis TaxID=149040 RepID=A0A194WX55_MOLSC|nr:SET domain-containing protein [Mollisia scopiformis]KUJ12563.1 SET domain-containing protein [Mollisia scopiformis]
MSALVNSRDPSYGQLERVLTAQKTAAQNAVRRKGERPRDLQPRSRCVDEYTMAALSNKMNNMESGHMMMTTVIGNPYPPSVTPLKDLEKVMIKDLTLETHHRGTYLLLRFICPAMRMSAVMNVAEDEAGTAIPFAVYMQEPESVRTAESILKDKRVIILKEPYFKLGTNGQYAVQVDHPSDITWLSEDDTRIPTKWKASDANTGTLWSAMEYFEAIELYSRAMRSSLTAEEAEILHNNRALANLRIDAFEAALNDISFVSNREHRLEKGLYREALALYGLERYTEAVEVLELLVCKYPESTSGKHELARSRLRLAEQETGSYDFKALYKATKLRPPRMDNATYKGPIEIRESKGRGRGLFTTLPVKAGDLLLCEKAFAYCFTTPQEEKAKTSSKTLSRSSYLMDIPHNRITVGTHADLIPAISNKLYRNPSLAPTFEDLFHDDYEGAKCVLIDGAPFLVARTMLPNAFGSPLTSKHMIDNPGSYNRDSGIGLGTLGIWTLASYVNHSCYSNCRRAFIGDLQIIRAARDMPADTELTFSYVTHQEPAELNKILLKGWGFQCDCIICVDDRETPLAQKIQRQKLIRATSGTSTKKKLELIEQLNSTYQRPSTEVPRLQTWDFHFSLVEEFAERSETNKEVIEQVLACFESVGFVIQGARLSPITSSTITIERWGLPHDKATRAWLTLRNVYNLLGKHDLADQAKEFARMNWMLITGEDMTFVYDNPTRT